MRLRRKAPKKQPVERPVLQLPIMREPEQLPKKEEATEDENPRGVAVIDFFV